MGLRLTYRRRENGRGFDGFSRGSIDRIRAGAQQRDPSIGRGCIVINFVNLVARQFRTMVQNNVVATPDHTATATHMPALATIQRLKRKVATMLTVGVVMNNLYRNRLQPF